MSTCNFIQFKVQFPLKKINLKKTKSAYMHSSSWLCELSAQSKHKDMCRTAEHSTQCTQGSPVLALKLWQLELLSTSIAMHTSTPAEPISHTNPSHDKSSHQLCR